MKIIEKNLDFSLYKSNILKINQNNVAYLKNFDKILFELTDCSCSLKVNKKDIIFKRKSKDNIFYLSLGENKLSYIELLEYNINMPIKIIYSSFNNIDNKYIIEYQLETEDDINKIEIIIND